MFQSVGPAVPDLKQRYRHKHMAFNDRESLLATIKTSVLQVTAHRNSAKHEAEKTSIKSRKNTFAEKKSRGKKKSGKTANFSILDEGIDGFSESRKRPSPEERAITRKKRGALKEASSGGRKGGRSGSSGGKKKSKAAPSYEMGDDDLPPPSLPKLG